MVILWADAIKFNTDVSFDANGNVNMTGNNEMKRKKQDSAAKKIDANVNLEKKETETAKQSHEVKDYSKQTKSKTDGWGLIFGIVVVMIWLFRKK